MTDTPNTAASAEREAIDRILREAVDPDDYCKAAHRFFHEEDVYGDRGRAIDRILALSAPPVEAGGVEAVVDEDEELPDTPLARAVYRHFVQFHMLNPDEAAESTAWLLPEIEAIARPTPAPAGLDGKVLSELEFIRGIATNLIRDIDEMEAAFSKSQRTRTTERKMASVRERAGLLVKCADDALTAAQEQGK